MKLVVRHTGLILAAVMLALLVPGFLAVNRYVASKIRQELQAAVNRSGNGLYRLDIKALHFNLFTGNARAHELLLRTDSALWETISRNHPARTPWQLRLSVRSVEIENIRWWKYYTSRRLTIDRVAFERPELDLAMTADSAKIAHDGPGAAGPGLLDRLPLLMAPFAKSVRIETLTVHNGRFCLRTRNFNKETIQSAGPLEWNLSKIHLDGKEGPETGRAFYAGNMRFRLQNYRLWTAGQRYLFHIAHAGMNGMQENLEMSDCTLRWVAADSITLPEPRLRRPKFRFRIMQATAERPDLYRALHRGEYSVGMLRVNGVDLHVENNMDLPPPSWRKMPNEAWQLLPFYLNADTVLIRNSNVRIREKMEGKRGTYTFLDAQLLLLNLSNDPGKMTDSTPARAYGSAKFMGEGDFSLVLSIPLLSPRFYCPYRVTLRNMPLAEINRLIVPKNNLRIEEGFSREITAKAVATNRWTRGWVRIYYEDLKLSVLNENSGEKKFLASAWTNLIVRKDSEVEKDDRAYRAGTIAYRREAADGFLRLLWRAAQNALFKTMTNSLTAPKKNGGRNGHKSG